MPCTRDGPGALIPADQSDDAWRPASRDTQRDAAPGRNPAAIVLPLDRCSDCPIDTAPEQAEHPALFPGSGVSLQEPAMLVLGLIISLVAAPFVVALAKRLHFQSWAIAPRLVLWLATAVVVAIAATYLDAWRASLGFAHLTWGGIGWGALAVIVISAAMSVQLYVQQRRGKQSERLKARYQALVGQPFGYRCFIVVTAAVTEEVLYRAYAIGVGAVVLGSLWLACVVSVIAFTLAHFRWGLAHLLSVFIAAAVLTALFAITRNVWVCILAHAVVNGVSFLAMPAASARRAARLQRKAG